MGYTCETGESEGYEILKTHYYKTSYDLMKAAVIEYFSKKGYEVTEFNDDYGEGMIIGKKLQATVKIIMQNPRETSVDFFVEYFGLFGKKQVALFLADFYDYCGKKFEFKGLGLHQ